MLLHFSLKFFNFFKISPIIKQVCACQILITFSTSDYLLNPVLHSIIKSLRITISFLCEQINASEEQIESTASNCIQLANCTEMIIRIRHLDNFNTINSKVKLNLLNCLNTIFINLTEVYPLLAIEMSKLIQLLNLK